MLLCLYLNASWTGSVCLPVNHLLLLCPNSLTGLRRQTRVLGLALVSLCVCGLGSKWSGHLLSGSLRLQPSSKNNIFYPWLQSCSIKIAQDCGTLPDFASELTSCTTHCLSQLPSEGSGEIFQDLVAIKTDNHYSEESEEKENPFLKNFTWVKKKNQVQTPGTNIIHVWENIVL